MRRVVCAAIRIGDHMVIGLRHFDTVMQRQIPYLLKDLGIGSMMGAQQGFIDQHGIFMDREEALAVASTAGQLLRKTPPAHLLFSEDLY